MNPLNSFSHRARTRTESATINGGLEIGLTILLFVLLGLAIDNWLGTEPAFVIGLFLFAAVGSGLRYYYTYTADMERLEAELATARGTKRSASVTAGTATPIATATTPTSTTRMEGQTLTVEPAGDDSRSAQPTPDRGSPDRPAWGPATVTAVATSGTTRLGSAAAAVVGSVDQQRQSRGVSSVRGVSR